MVPLYLKIIEGLWILSLGVHCISCIQTLAAQDVINVMPKALRLQGLKYSRLVFLGSSYRPRRLHQSCLVRFIVISCLRQYKESQDGYKDAHRR